MSLLDFARGRRQASVAALAIRHQQNLAVLARPPRKRILIYHLCVTVVFFLEMTLGVESVLAGVLLQRQTLGKTVAIVPNPVGNEIWAATSTGLYVIASTSDGGMQTQTVVREPVTGFATGTDGAWLTTDRECDFVSWTNRRAVPKPGVSGRLVAVQSTAKDTFLFTTSGIFQTSSDATRAASGIGGAGEFMWRDVVTVGETAYAASGNSLYRVTSNAVTRISIGSSIVRLATVDKTIFLGTWRSVPLGSIDIARRPGADQRQASQRYGIQSQHVVYRD